MFKKFKGHYAERKTSERDVISYEDMPLDDYEQEKTDISPEAVKKILIGVCIALAAGLIVFAFANRDNLTWDNISNWWTYDVLGNAGNGYPVNLIGTEVKSGNFAVNQGHVAYASDTSFVTLNSTGSEVANVQLRYSKPVMKSSGNRFLTYGIGTTGYQIQDFDGMLYSGEAEGAIYTADISSNGVYGIVTEGSGYLSVLYVFNSNNNRIYKYSFSEYYINSISLNSDGSGCVACGITSDNGAVKTGVYVLDFTKEEPVSQYSINGDTIVDSDYLNDNRIVLVGQSSSYVIKRGEENYVTVEYDSKTLANYCFNPDTNSFALALSKSGDGRSCAIEIYNDNGEKTSSIDTDYGAESISLYKGTVAILDGNTAYGLNSEGTQLYSCDTGTGSKRLILTSDNTAYVLSVNQVRFFDLSKTSTKDTAN
ncbi:DUF5711 family protein [uncultured Ruminococcus sp.]|uniref:DUF5711 family protein n=1 Tax=uncultured Ruminococcus sp. TaxID=165186 RepID=UPI0025DAA127|nr:DUF5711 family protein [uncultured Ruminococcus sp.]